MRPSDDPSGRLLRAGALALCGAALALLGLLGTACPGRPPPPTHQVVVVPVPVPVVVPAAPKPTPVWMAVVGCSHGTTGISAANAPQPHWIIAAVRVSSPRPVRGLRVASVDLLDRRGRVLSRLKKVESIRIGLPQPNPRTTHLYRSGTLPFDGRLTPLQRHRLWLHVRLDGDYHRIARARPARCRISLSAPGLGSLQAHTDQIGGWPTG